MPVPVRAVVGTAEEMIGRHSKQFGSEYDDAVESIQGGKLGLTNPLLWFVLATPPDERKARQS
ncbi:hypothetical protein [Fontivita pretiosa]|jgi:hypothetical protein|uniref:hypothetical protein n=1 Tax=Fontivita pretiosa TaxID=2989684 RepID=UPI003D172511